MKNYTRTYLTIQMHKNPSHANNKKAPEHIMRNLKLSVTFTNHIVECVKNNRAPDFDVAVFSKNENDVVVTISVPFFKNKHPTTIEEFFE